MELAYDKFTQRVMDITPAIAAKMLEANTDNFRPLAQESVASFAEQMKAGKWYLGGGAIKFAQDGTLVDGQHTLAAVVASEATIQSSVVFGVEKDAVPAIDTGRSRSVQDVFNYLGVANPPAAAATLQVIRMILGGLGPGKRRIAPQMLFAQWYAEYRCACNWAVTAVYAKTSPCRNQAVAGALALAYHCHGYKAALSEFAEALVSGVDLSASSPALAVRKYFMEKGLAYKSDTTRARALKVLSAAMAYVKGEDATRLYADAGLRAVEFFVKDAEAVQAAQQAV